MNGASLFLTSGLIGGHTSGRARCQNKRSSIASAQEPHGHVFVQQNSLMNSVIVSFLKSCRLPAPGCGLWKRYRGALASPYGDQLQHLA